MPSLLERPAPRKRAMLLFGVSLRLDDQVVLVTGAVVDQPWITDGLRALGATLVEGGDRPGVVLVEETVRSHGRVDALVHALGSGPSGRLDFGAVDLHARTLVEFFDVVHPAWTAMRDNGSGRVVLVWPSGKAGDDPLDRLGTDPRAVAGLGAVGLVNVLKLEVGERDLRANAVVPSMGADGASSALVDYLVHPTCELNGAVLTAGADGVRRLFIGVTPGEFNGEISTAWVAGRALAISAANDFIVPSEGGGEMPLLKQHFG